MDIKTNDGCIEIKMINASKLSVSHNLNKISILKGTKGNIEQLIFTEEYRIVLGDTLKIRNGSIDYEYDVMYIKQIDNTHFTIESTKKNKSSIFILPLIADKNGSDFLNYSSYFFNSYLYYVGFDTYNDGNHLFVEYRFFDTEFFYEMEKRLTSLPGYIKSIQPNRNFTVYIFKIPELFEKDIKLFLKGKYSSISTTAKARIILFHKVKVKDYIAQILSRDKDLRKKMELEFDCEIPDNIDLLTKPNIEDEKL